MKTFFSASGSWQVSRASCTIVRMDVVTDTSVIIAVITNSPEKDALAEVTRESALVAPASVHWEIGNNVRLNLFYNKFGGAEKRGSRFGSNLNFVNGPVFRFTYGF